MSGRWRPVVKIRTAIATLVAVEAVVVASWLRGEIGGREALAAGLLAAAPVIAGYLQSDDTEVAFTFTPEVPDHPPPDPED